MHLSKNYLDTYPSAVASLSQLAVPAVALFMMYISLYSAGYS